MVAAGAMGRRNLLILALAAACSAMLFPAFSAQLRGGARARLSAAALPQALKDAAGVEDPPALPPYVYSFMLLSDYCNVLAGFFLSVAFAACALTFHAGAIKPEVSEALIKLTLFLEGVLYCVGSIALGVWTALLNDNVWSGISAGIFPALGGMFFAFSAFGSPIFIISLKYVFFPPTFCDACAHYGITCFMIGTARNLYGLLTNPNPLGPHYWWGVVFFFIGAWTIGLINLWLPTLAGGCSRVLDNVSPEYRFGVIGTYPSFTWTWKLWFALAGAISLSLGALHFGSLDGTVGFP